MDPENPDDRRVAQLALAAHNHDSPLFKLPVDLIDYIFELAYHHPGPGDFPFDPLEPTSFVRCQPAHRPICRGLRDIQQRQLYRHLQLMSLSKLFPLARALVEDKAEPGLGSFVASLTLGSEGASSWWASLPYRHQEQRLLLGEGRPYHFLPPGEAPKLLKDLLGKLTGLKSLGVFLSCDRPGDDDALAMLRVVFRDPSALAHLSSIQEVYLESSGSALDAAFPDDAGAWLTQLSGHRHLETLSLGFSEHSLPSILQTTSAARPVLGELRKLRLYGKFEAWRVRLCDLAPKLACLEIENSQSWSERPALRSIAEHAPPTVVELAISVAPHDPDEPPESSQAIDDLLPRLALLRTIRLDFACYDPTRLPSSLARLANLELLHLGRGAILPQSTLLGVVTGPHRLKSLRKLILDYIAGVKYCFGPTLRSTGGRLPRDEWRDASGLWYGWVPPQWPEGCSEAIVGGVVSAARAHGIVVAGSAVRALDWAGEYVAARDAVARRRGVERGDWRDARRFLGARIVELLKEEQQAARGWPEGFAGALLRC
ncbi:hypothetical protein JCM9279_004023 [Rhodotorula babjevae]